MNNSIPTTNDVVFTSHTAGTALSPMSPSDFYVFFERYVFGGQVIQQFEPEKSFDYLYKGEIVRYNPDLTPVSDALCVIIDLDGAVSPIRIPSAIWEYAFETGTLPYQFDSEYFNSHIKVVFVSKQQRMICKASLFVLLILAQEIFPLASLTHNQIRSVTQHWLSIHTLLERFGAENPQDLQGDIELVIEKSKIFELIALVQDKRCLMNSFVEELWKLSIADQSKQPDFSFAWVKLHISDQAVKDLYYNWQETPWIARCTKLGESYSYPVFPISDGLRESMVTFEKCTFLTLAGIPFCKIQSSVESFHLRTIPVQWQDYWYYRIEYPLSQFIQFYRQIFQIDLQVVNMNKGVVIFQEMNKSDTSVTMYIILKGKHYGLAAEGYSAGLYLASWLLNSHQDESLRIRLFEFSPQEEIQEYDFAAFKEVCAPLIESLRPQISDLVQSLTILRNEGKTHIDLSLHDIFGHPTIRSVWEGTIGFRAIIGAWMPSETSTGKEITWVSRFASTEDLQTFLVQNFGEDEDDRSSPRSSHPVLELLDGMIDIVEVLNDEKR